MPDTAEPPVSNDSLPKREDFNTYYDDDITVPGAFLIRDRLEKKAKKEIVEEKQDDVNKTDRERYFDRFKVEDEELKKEIPSDEISEERIKQEEENALTLNRRIIQTEDRRMKRGFFDGPDMRQDARIIEDAQQKFQDQQNITSEARIAYWQQKIAEEKRKQEEERQKVWHPKAIQTIITDKEMKRVLMGSPPNEKSTRTAKKPKVDLEVNTNDVQQSMSTQEADPNLVENPVTLQPTVTFESMNEDLVKAREELQQNNEFTSEEEKEKRVQIYREQQTKMAEQWLQEKQVLVESFANVIHANRLGEADVATIKKELELSFVDHNARIGLISRLEDLYKITRTTKIGAENVDFYHQFKKALETIEGGIIYTHTEIIGKTYLELTQGGIPFEYSNHANEGINIQTHKATAINHFGFKPNQGSLQPEIKANIVFEEKLGITQRIAKTWNSVTDSIFGKISEPVEQVKPESQTEPEFMFDLDYVTLPKIPDIKLDAFVTEDELVQQYKQFVTSQQNQMTFDYQHLRREVFLAKYKLSEDIHPDELKNIDLDQLMKMAFAYQFADNSENMLIKVSISDPSAPISQYSYSKFNDTNIYGFKFSPEELVKFDAVITSFEERIKGFQEAERKVSLTTTKSLTTEPQVDLKTRNNVEKKYRVDLVIDLLKENGVTPDIQIVDGLLRAIATEETLNFGEDLLARRILDFLNEDNFEVNFSTSSRPRPIDPFAPPSLERSLKVQSAPLQLDDLVEINNVASPIEVKDRHQNSEEILQQLQSEFKKLSLNKEVTEEQQDAISELQFKYIDQFIDTNEKPLQELLSNLRTVQAGYNYVPATIDEFKQAFGVGYAKSNLLSITGARYTLNQLFNALNQLDSQDQQLIQLFDNLHSTIENATFCNIYFPEDLKKKSRSELIDLGFSPYVNGVLRNITSHDSLDNTIVQVDFLGNYQNTSLITFKKEDDLEEFITKYYHSMYVEDNRSAIHLRVTDTARASYLEKSNSSRELFEEISIISNAIGFNRIKKEDVNINEIVNIQGKAVDLWMKENRTDSQTTSDFEVGKRKGIDTQINDSKLNEQEKMQLKDALNDIVANGSYNHDNMLAFMKQIGTFVTHNKGDKNLGEAMDKLEELLKRVSAVTFIGREVMGKNIGFLNNSYFYGNVWTTDQIDLPIDAEVSEVIEFGFIPTSYFPIEYPEQKMKLKFTIPVSQDQNNNETT